MMKKITAVFLALLMVLMMSGCHGSLGIPEFSIPESFDTSRNYELTFWAKNDTNKAQTDIYYQAIEDFQKAYPNIKVNMRLYTDYGRIYNDVITNISTNTTPNICITYPDHIATYMTGSGTVVSLDQLMDDPKYGLGGSELQFEGPTRQEIIPQFLSECAIGGVTYALPYMRSTEALYINKDFVEKLGYTVPDVVTWDWIWEVSEAAMAQDADGTFTLNGQKVMIPFIYKSTDNMMIQYLKQMNAGYSTEDGQIEIFNDVTRGFLQEIRQHAETRSFSTFKISSYPANFLNAGQCLFAVDSTAGATWMGSHAPLIDIAPENLVEFETVVRPVPQVDPANPQMISQGPSICIFNKADTQEVLASWLFAQYLLSNKVQIAYSETEGYVPVTSKAQSSAEYQDYLSRSGEDGNAHYDIKIQASQLLLNNVEHTFTTPVFNGSTSLRDAAGHLIENVVLSVRRGQTVDENYLDQLYQDTTSLYRLDQVSQQAGSSGADADLGPLPSAAVTLIVVLVCAWVMIGVVYLAGFLKKKKAAK